MAGVDLSEYYVGVPALRVRRIASAYVPIFQERVDELLFSMDHALALAEVSDPFVRRRVEAAVARITAYDVWLALPFRRQVFRMGRGLVRVALVSILLVTPLTYGAFTSLAGAAAFLPAFLLTALALSGLALVSIQLMVVLAPLRLAWAAVAGAASLLAAAEYLRGWHQPITSGAATALAAGGVLCAGILTVALGLQAGDSIFTSYKAKRHPHDEIIQSATLAVWMLSRGDHKQAAGNLAWVATCTERHLPFSLRTGMLQVDEALQGRCERIASALREQSVRTALNAQDIDPARWVAGLLVAAAREEWASIDMAEHTESIHPGRWRSMLGRLRLLLWTVLPIAIVLALRFIPLTSGGEPVIKDETFGALITFALAWLLTGIGSLLDPRSGERTAAAKNISDMISR